MPNSKSLDIDPSWLPTPDAINALPLPSRDYIHRLEANLDPGGMVQENTILRTEREQLVAKLAELQGGKKR